MIRHPDFPLSNHSEAYRREELIRLRDLRDRVLEYGGWELLLNDIEGMEGEINRA